MNLQLSHLNFLRDRRAVVAVAALWLAVAVILGLHFWGYYGVGWRDALKWGAGDGFFWCLLFGVVAWLHRIPIAALSPRWRLAATLFAAIAGAVIMHPMSVVVLYWAIDGEIGRPFFDDVAHLASKRFPFGVLAGVVMTLAVTAMRRSPRAAAREAKAATPSEAFVLVKSGNGVRRLELKDIRYIEAAGNYVSIVTADDDYLERATMTAMVERLRGQGFQRLSRKHLVNLDHVSTVKSAKSKSALAMLNTGASLPVSRNHRRALLEEMARRAAHPASSPH